MKENRGTTILLTVIGIATLLVAVVGATFAYFTAGVSGNDANTTDITVNSATVGKITFTHGDTIDLCDDTLENCSVIYPGAQEAKSFTVQADANSTTAVDYSVYLYVEENTFTTEYLKYKLSATTAAGTVPEGATATASTLPTLSTDYTVMNNAVENAKFAAGKEVLLATATLGTYGATDTWTLDVLFENLTTGEQGDQGAVFSGQIRVKADTKYTSGDDNKVSVYTGA